MADVQALAQSEIFDPVTGFGGDGDRGRRGGGCVVDGPFAGLVLNLNENFVSRPYCLSRAFNQAEFAAATIRNVNECFALDGFDKAWPCYEGRPHDAGHNGVGGVVSTVPHTTSRDVLQKRVVEKPRESHGAEAEGRG